jgi:hypothetical protein
VASDHHQVAGLEGGGIVEHGEDLRLVLAGAVVVIAKDAVFLVVDDAILPAVGLLG